MLESHDLPYYVCRRYLADKGKFLPVEMIRMIEGWLRARALKQLASASDIHDQAKHGREVFKILLQVEAFFKKYANLANDDLCLEAAQSSFITSELRCEYTNQRLESDFIKEEVPPLVSSMIQDIRDLLCEHDGQGFQRFLEDVPSLIRFTSGATATRPRSKATPYLKMHKNISAPLRAAPLVTALAEWFGYKVKPKSLEENRITVVPKSWKTHRTIACEPDGSLPLQLCLDSHIKKRLRRWGVTLNDQGPNQELARVGSLEGTYATIDLEAASDSLAYNAVWLLLPEEFADFADRIRSSRWKWEGFGSGSYSKFSSMGNGATFTLETMVFAAACRAVGSRNFRCYGDDIVIETERAAALIELLSYLGFKVNESKTHTKGQFRESCGANWYDGEDVTPFYLRHYPANKAEWCHLVNGLVSVGTSFGDLWDYGLELTRELSLPIVPFSEDTMSGVHASVHECHRRKVIRKVPGHPWLYRFKGYRFKSKSSAGGGDSRHLILWYFQAHYRGSVPGPDVARRVARKPARGRYVRAWCPWIGTAATPLAVLSWSAYLELAHEG